LSAPRWRLDKASIYSISSENDSPCRNSRLTTPFPSRSSSLERSRTRLLQFKFFTSTDDRACTFGAESPYTDNVSPGSNSGCPSRTSSVSILPKESIGAVRFVRQAVLRVKTTSPSGSEGMRSKYFEPLMHEFHLPKRGSAARCGRRNHDSRKLHLGDVFIDCSYGLGAV